MNIEYETFTNIGNRPINEDYVTHYHSSDQYCFILCDGLGGHGKGELASSYVGESIKNSFICHTDFVSFFSKCFEEAQYGLLNEQKRLNARFEMKTTAVVLAIDNNQFQYAHIGDSRLYHFRKNKIISRTLDHSVPQMLVLAGDIKEKSIRSHPDRNRLLRVLGVDGDTPRYELSEIGVLRPGDSFLLCSDGFWEPVLEKQMCKLLKKSKSASEWMNLLQKEVKLNGQDANMDNYSAITIMCKE